MSNFVDEAFEQALTRQAFAAFAKTDVTKWSMLIGQTIIHKIYGQGKIIDLQNSPKFHEYCLYIEFAEETRHFKIAKLSNDDYVLSITIPHDVDDQIQAIARRIREKVQRQRVEEHQREEERQARNEFIALKEKYLADGFRDCSPASPLFAVLLQIDSCDTLDDAQIDWLKEQDLLGTLAHYYQNMYRVLGEPWDLVKASSFWRDAKQPDRAITLTSYLLERHNVQDFKLKSAILTTRGGAFRDLGSLLEAEDCALQALQVNRTSFQPHNLLGAIYFARGQPEKGEEHFETAVSLGSQAKYLEGQMKRALDSADQTARQTTAQYLLRKDPEKYRWANFYLTR